MIGARKALLQKMQVALAASVGCIATASPRFSVAMPNQPTTLCRHTHTMMMTVLVLVRAILRRRVLLSLFAQPKMA